MVVNEHEAGFLLGDALPDPERARPVASATALLARGPRSVVITLGAQGSYPTQDQVPS